MITPLRQDLIPAVIELMGRGGPFITARTWSDYWLYASLFSTTCPVALDDGAVIGAVIAFRSQDSPDDIYIQDVMIHPDHRRRGLTRRLIAVVRDQGRAWHCARLYLTSEPGNQAANQAWKRLGFTNIRGDRTINGVSVVTDYKGPGKTRAVYELLLDGPGYPGQ
jgi:GNAT superfamily N-acetyltransferase